MNKIKYTLYHDQLDFEKIIYEYLWIAKNNHNLLKRKKTIIFLIKFFLRTLYNSLVTYPAIKFSKFKNSSIFYIRALNRSDLSKHSKYYESVDGTTVCVFKERKLKINVFIFIKCLTILLNSRKLWLKAYKSFGIKFFSLNGLKIFIILFDACSDALKILPNLLNHSKLVSFEENVPVENIICQIANINKIETFALQHAIAAFKEDGPVEVRYPICNYLNSVCKNVLAWGNYNKKFFEKYTNAKVFIVGKPALPLEKPSLDGVTVIFENIASKETNSKLFSLSKSLLDKGIPVSHWFKPGHILNESNVIRQGPLRKTVIGVNTSLCVELGFLGFQVFLLEKSSLAEFLPNKLILKTYDEISSSNLLLEDYPYAAWKHFIECSGNESVARYKNIILNDKTDIHKL